MPHGTLLLGVGDTGVGRLLLLRMTDDDAGVGDDDLITISGVGEAGAPSRQGAPDRAAHVVDR